MRKKISTHVAYYISLIVIFLMGFLLIEKSSFNIQLKILIFSLITFFYIILGIVHHLLNHKLSAKIVIEYILIGSFGIAVVFFLLKGGLGI